MRLRRALAAEEKKFGMIRDGAGKRYLIGPLFVLAGQLDRALAHYAWYEEYCSEDTGEPIHYLYWAIALYRTGDAARANQKLLETTVQNLYLLPTLLGSPPAIYDMWHSSNMEERDYIFDTPEELVPSLSDEEQAWIRAQLESDRFCRVRDEYVSTYHALQGERVFDKRGEILSKWREFWAEHAGEGD